MNPTSMASSVHEAQLLGSLEERASSGASRVLQSDKVYPEESATSSAPSEAPVSVASIHDSVSIIFTHLIFTTLLHAHLTLSIYDIGAPAFKRYGNLWQKARRSSRIPLYILGVSG